MSRVTKEVLQRVNYLYAVAIEYIRLYRNTRNESYIAISRQSTSTMLNICKKTQLRIVPSVKRFICKSCRIVLVSGITGEVRQREGAIVIGCNACGEERKIIVNEHYELKIEREEQKTL